MEVFYLIFFFAFILLFIKRKGFIYFLPIIHVVFDMSFTFFARFSMASYIRGLFLVFFYAIFAKYIFRKKFIWLYVFVVYSAILVMQSGEFLSSLKEYMKILFSMMILPIGYSYIRNIHQFNRLNRYVLLILPLSLAAVLFGYIFGIGSNLVYTLYAEGLEENIGMLGSGGLYTGAFIIGILPLLLKSVNKTQRNVYIIIAIILYIFILLNVRRTAILIPIVSLVIFFITSTKKKSFVVYGIVFLMSLMILSPFYLSKLESRYAVRQDKIEGDYTQESRYLENINLLQEMSEFKDGYRDLFGFGNNPFAEHRKDAVIIKRMFHTDTAKLLYAVGFIGLLVYFIFYFSLLRNIFKIKKSNNLYSSSLYAIFMVFVLMALNGSLLSISLRTLMFLYFGAILSMANEDNKLKKQSYLL